MVIKSTQFHLSGSPLLKLKVDVIKNCGFIVRCVFTWYFFDIKVPIMKTEDEIIIMIMMMIWFNLILEQASCFNSRRCDNSDEVMMYTIKWTDIYKWGMINRQVRKEANFIFYIVMIVVTVLYGIATIIKSRQHR